MPNVIVVSTDHDPVTRALASYASKVVGAASPAVQHLHNVPASNVVSAIKGSSSDYVFFFVHGRDNPPGVIDQFGSPIVDNATVGLLASRTVCATCYSLNAFATIAVKFGVTIVGYNGKMLIPLDQRYIREMEDAAITPHRLLLSGSAAAAAAAAAGAKYMDVARKWIRVRSIRAQLYAAAAQWNSQAIGSMP